MSLEELKDGALLRPDQVADLMKVTRRTIYNWINSGKLPAMIVAGRSIRIRKEDLMVHIISPGEEDES